MKAVRAPLLALVALAACARTPAPAGLVANPVVASLRELGLVPDPPGAFGRDGGYSAQWNGRSVWVFGDTFLPPAADGYGWRASTWSWTFDLDASDGLSAWAHGLDAQGKPRQLIPHTPDEQAFNDAHNGADCPARIDCGARRTAWPAAVVVPQAGPALVFFSTVETHLDGPFSFRGTGSSAARWDSPDAPATRGGLLFSAADPPFGAAALLDGDDLYAWACPGGGLTAPCKLGKVPYALALDRGSWRFWDGAAWSPSLAAAQPVLEGAPMMSVHYSAYLKRYLAVYLVPLGQQMALRTAPRPEGPWSAQLVFANARPPPQESQWDYGLIAHPELAREGGRVELLSYDQPGVFLDGVVRLVEITLQ